MVEKEWIQDFFQELTLDDAGLSLTKPNEAN